MNTGQYYFDKLSAKEQKEFRYNFIRWKIYLKQFSFQMYLNSHCRDFYDFVTNSFTWIKTPQGYNYWLEISHRKVD